MPLPKDLPTDLTSANDGTQVLANRYTLGKKLGAGNFGTAYLIHDNKLSDGEEKKKVLKQICVGNLDPGETVSAMHEAQLLSRLQHENIVQFHDSFLDGQFFCIVTEFCEGGDLDVSLQACRKKKTFIEEQQAVKWLKQLLEALRYMHDKRILHRDLKTKNIFLKQNKVKVGDFGISRILMGTSDMASTFVGTPYYMSPEVLKHEHYDEKSDIWSLGCVLYEICCLKHAFEGNSLMTVMYKIVSGETPELPEIYSQALNVMLSKMLARDPRNRQTAKEMLSHNIFSNSKSSLTTKEKVNLTPKERLRLNKQKRADEKFRRHKMLAEQNFAENERRHKESLTKNFHRTQVESTMQNNEMSRRRTVSDGDNIFNNNNNSSSSVKQNERTSSADPGTLVHEKPMSFIRKTYHPSNESDLLSGDTLQPNDESNTGSHDGTLEGTSIAVPFDGESTDELAEQLLKEGIIPEDADLADTYYSINEDFESDLEDDLGLVDDHVHLSDSEYKEMLGLMEDALDLEGSTYAARTKNGKTKTMANTVVKNKEAEPTSVMTTNVMDARITNMRKNCLEKMGKDVFEKAYGYLRSIWSNHVMPAAPDYTSAMKKLGDIVHDDKNCFLLEQLIYLENEKALGYL